MRRLVVEFILPAEDEEAYAGVCAELVVEDFLGRPLRVLEDSAREIKEPGLLPAKRARRGVLRLAEK